MDISVVIPAHNEESLLAGCLEALSAAAEASEATVEVIVVANRCTDRTVDIADDAGAVVVENSARNIAAVRNAGAGVAAGDAIVTVDADCLVDPATLTEVRRLLNSGQYVGGGTKVIPERSSPGINATYALMELLVGATRLGGGAFWCHRSDFEAIGGFDESLLLGEDLDFARRLRAHGRKTDRRFTNIRTAPVVASCRKFDRYGDWHMFAMALQLREIRAALKGTDPAWVDRYFFDFNAGTDRRD